MKATTHTEVYRPFHGKLRGRPFRALVLARSAIRQGHKKKLPLLVLYVVPYLLAVVFCFIVYLKFTAEAGQLPGMAAERSQAMAQMAGALLEVEQQIYTYVDNVRVFALLAIAWFGAGLVAEDRRLGAHLLYFSRPLSRFDYILGKFLGAAFFGFIILLVPSLLICAVAAVSSPEWSFVKEKGHVIAATAGYGLLWIATFTAVVLTVSSLVERKTLALAGIFGGVFLFEAASNVLAELTEDDRWRLLSIFANFGKIAEWAFDRPERYSWNVGASMYVIGALIVVCLTVLWRRARRMEVLG